MQEIGRKIAKDSVSEALPPEQRLDEIEEKLSKLNEKWKERVGLCFVSNSLSIRSSVN